MLQKIKNMNPKQKKTAIIVAAVVLLFIVAVIWIAVDNKALELNSITVESDRLPQAFDGYRIALVSDLHNDEFGENNQTLLDALRESEPDLIAITGDIIDSRRTNAEIALRFAAEAVMIAPCYYVSGNHESRIEEYPEFRDALTELGVTVLENERATLSRNGETVTLIGLTDLGFLYKGDAKVISEMVVSGQIGELVTDNDGYTIMLTHRPAFFEIYAEHGIDLSLCGHIHGGQIRLPLIGGLAGGESFLLPEYDAGLYTDGDSSMIVSRGLGNSLFPFRVNNRPEVVLIELKS